MVIIHKIRSTATAALLIGMCVAVSNLISASSSESLFADDIVLQAHKQASEAKSMTWKVTYYQHFVTKDGKKHKWGRIANSSQNWSYRPPGLYRAESRDNDDKLAFLSIEDVVSRAKLDVNPRDKSATLNFVAQPNQSPSGPLAKALDVMQNASLMSLGKKYIADREASGYRFTFFSASHNLNWSYELWIDLKSKRLVRWQIPGGDLMNAADIIELDQDSMFAKSIEIDGATFERPTGLSSVGHAFHDIKFDVELDDAIFSLKPPEGYALRTPKAPEIKEQDVIEFLGIVAEYFGKKFPDQMPHFNHGPVEYDRFERIERDVVMKKKGMTPGEINMVEAMHKWWSTGIPGPGPLHIFIQQHIVGGSWKYLGKGVKLGDKSQIVCWYQLKGAAKYRVVFGDLSVKDVAAEDLPLPVGP